MQKRGKWQYVLPLMATIGLFGVLAVPATRWLFRTQVLSGFFSPREYAWTMQVLGIQNDRPQVDTSTIREKLQAAVARHPGEYHYELAAAVLMPAHTEEWKSLDVVAALRSLQERFPQEPSLYAHILRFGSMGELRIGRPEENQATDRPPQRSFTPNAPDTTKLWEYMAAAEKGIALEPDNAYFYAMRSIVRFGLHQDEDALEDMHRGATCPRYEDYSWDESGARLALLREAFGEQSGLTELAQAASILFPHYAKLRSTARMAVYEAIRAEQAGNYKEGIAIREDVMRFGSLMRRQSRSYIGTLVGIALVNMGSTRPGGEYTGVETEADNAIRNEGTDSEKRVEAQAQRKLEIFTNFLNQHERGDLVAWVRSEVETGKEVKAVGTAGLKDHIYDSKQITRLAGLWIVCVTVLRNAIWMLIFGGLALFLTRRHATPGRGAGLFFLSVFGAAMVFMFTNQPIAWYIGSTLSFLNSMMSEQGGTDFSGLLKGITVIGAMAIPMLMLIVASVVSLFCRIPVSLGVLRVFRGLSVPVACTLLLLYSAAVLATAREESHVKHELRQMIQHEGYYLAEHAGRAWPEN